MIEEFVSDDPDHFKRLSRGNRIDDQISMNTDVQLGVHQAVFILLQTCQRLIPLPVLLIVVRTCPAVSMISVRKV